jgi:hypothetical protein
LQASGNRKTNSLGPTSYHCMTILQIDLIHWLLATTVWLKLMLYCFRPLLPRRQAIVFLVLH